MKHPYVITEMKAREGNPGLFIRAELLFDSGVKLTTFVASRGLNRMPMGATTVDCQVNDARWHVTVPRCYTREEAAAACYIQGHARDLIGTLLAAVEDERL